MNDLTHAAQFQSDVRLVRSFTKYGTPMTEIVAAMRDSGRSEHHVTSVLATAGQPEDLDAPAPAEQLSVWTLTRMDPCSTVQEGDYHEMYVVAKTPEAAREWAYLRALGDNKPEPKVWLEGDEFALRVLHFYDVDDNATTGVQLAETWTVEKMATVPFRRR